MASIPPADAGLAIHLTDRALTPLISSSRPSSTTDRDSQTQSQALSSLTTSAVTAYDSASRLGLGRPQRIMVETSSGPIILHSYLNPQPSERIRSQSALSHVNGRGIVDQARDELRPLTATTDNSSTVGHGEGNESLVNGVANGVDNGNSESSGRELAERAEEGGTLQLPPLLIATVVAAGPEEATEARRAAARLERTGREFQREWIREQEEEHETAGPAEDG